jgi:4-hydroxy-2-oxoheptanedioate aldolase
MAYRIKELLAQGKLVRVYGLGQFCHPKHIEVVAMHGGHQAIWLDQEHAGLTLEQIEVACLAARASGLDSFVRLAPTDYATVMHPLEAGAGGIMAAQVRSAKQVEEIVQWAKFHPRGQRGINGGGYDGGYGSTPFVEYLRKANAETFVIIQIEHVGALEEVEQIAAIPDVDVLFIGPADLSQSMGLPADWDQPKLWEAFARVAQAAKANGIHWAILPTSPTAARRCVEMGCRMLSIGFDTVTLHHGLRAYWKEYAEWLWD